MERKVMTSVNKYNIVCAVPDIPPIDPPPGRWGQRRRNNLRYLKEIRKRGLIKEDRLLTIQAKRRGTEKRYE
jgi:hypothetical protein